MKRKTTEQFTEEAKAIHNNRYDYSLVEYVNTDIKVNIICKEHGVFAQTPKGHLQNWGCPICSGKEKSSEQLILEFTKVHGDLYDYSLVKYASASQKVKIKCEKHGTFLQLPGDHKYGYGCPGCFIKRPKTNDRFVTEAKEVHGNRYDYSLVDYKTAHTKIKIRCEKHGTFQQRPSDHLRLNGCPDCAKRGYVPSKGGWLYYIKFSNDHHEFYKIGITNGEIHLRIRHFYLTKDIVPEIVFSKWFDDGYIPQKIERNILNIYKDFKFDQAPMYMKNGFSETFNKDVLQICENFDVVKQFL